MNFLKVMAKRYKELAQDSVEALEHGQPDKAKNLESKAYRVWDNMEKLIGRDAVMREVFG